MDAMNGKTFERHIAKLLIRDGCTNVVVQGGHGDRGVDVIGLTADGRRLVVQCKRHAPYQTISSPDIQKFIGSAKVLYSAEVALFVATCPFTPDALQLAAETGMTTWKSFPRQSLAFLSRRPVASSAWVRPRVSRHAFIEVVPEGTPVRLFGVHLSAVHAAWTERRRVLELRALLRRSWL